MDRNNNGIQQQVFDHINKANQVLVVLPAKGGGDAVGAGLALYGFLKKLDKDVDVVSDAASMESYKFLPNSEVVASRLEAAQSFVVSVDTSNSPLDELSYEVKDKRVDIFLKPKQGRFKKEDVSFGSARFPYDLVIVLDAPSLDHLGKVYEENTDLFFETPIINLDHHPNNEQYGEINLVDITATATAEIVTTLIENFEENLIDADIATSLLLGIIVETNSFQHVKTTPRAFLKASRLVSAGAKQQEIVRELYKTKNISLLKLWGRALARVQQVSGPSAVYTLISKTDMEKCQAEESDLWKVMQELVGSLSESRIVILLAELAPQQIKGYFHIHPSVKPQVFAAGLDAQMLNGSYGRFVIQGTGLADAEKQIVEMIEKHKAQLAI